MTGRTRRAVLASGGALLAGVAGCLGTPRDTDATATSTTTTDSTTSATTTETTRTTTSEPEHLAWSRPLDATAGPYVVDDSVFVGTRDSGLHALAPDGSDAWTFDPEYPVHDLLVAEDVVYAVTGAQSSAHLTNAAVEAAERGTGERRWRVPVEAGYRTPTPLGVAGGVLGVGLSNDRLKGSGKSTFGVDVTDGTEVWRVETGDVREGAAGGTTVYAAEYGELTAFDAATGDERWARSRQVGNPPLLLGDVALVAADPVTALDPESGESQWTFGEDLDLAGAVKFGNRAYTRGKVVAALDAAGTVHWRSDRGGGIDARDGDLLFGDDESRLFALDAASGDERWAIDKPAKYFDVPAATRGVVAGGAEQTVYAYDQASGESAFTFDVHDDHVKVVTATSRRLVVSDDPTRYGLEP